MGVSTPIDHRGAAAVTASPATGTFTVSSTANCLLVTLNFDQAAGMAVTAVTYNGLAMTACGTTDTNATKNPYSAAFYLVNPPTGSAFTISITISGTITDIYWDATTYSGVNTTTPVRAGTYQAPTNPTSTAGGTYAIVVSSNTSDRTITVLNSPGGTTGSDQSGGGTYITTAGAYSGSMDYCTTPAASVTHTWSGLAATDNLSIVAFSLNGDPNTAVVDGVARRVLSPRRAPFTIRTRPPTGLPRRYWVGDTSSGTTTVSSSSVVQYEALQELSQSQAVIEEALASVNQGQTIIEETLGSIATGQLVQDESLGSVSAGQVVQDEALQGIAAGQVVTDEALGVVALTQLVIEEALGSVVAGQVVQDESLGFVSLGQVVQDEALGGIIQSLVVQDEVLGSISQALVVQYEAQGVVTTPVSNSVAVILEALQQLGPTTAVIEEATGLVTKAQVAVSEAIASVSVLQAAQTESLGSVSASTTARLEALATALAGLLVALEAGGSALVILARISARVDGAQQANRAASRELNKDTKAR